jgi:beta-glucosidase
MLVAPFKRNSCSASVVFASAFLSACGSGTNVDTPSAATAASTGTSVVEASADQRAKSLLAQMSTEQKLAMVHGYGMPNLANQAPSRNSYVVPKEAIQTGAGFIPGIPALGIPDTNVADSAISVAVPNAHVTSFPSNVALAATWDTDLAYTYGKRIAIELRELGFTTGLGGGINLTRDPRLGRQFEYMGEDPILAGELVAQRTIGTQSQKVIATIKHYAFNGYETNRFVSNSVVDEQTMRETELLGFEIGITKGQPGNVMCSYNLVNGVYACENSQLLNDWLKKEWGFKGVVQSDWGATASTAAAANNGLDESQPT